MLPGHRSAQIGTVEREQKISQTEGGFGGNLHDTGGFGVSVAALDDLDGDGNGDLAVGEFTANDGGENQGAVWILFLDEEGSVAGQQKISHSSGGLGGALQPDDMFGVSVASLGDLDGDGVCDLAVGAYGDDGGGVDRGAVWILFLNPDGTVSHLQKITEEIGGFGGSLEWGGLFGSSLARLDDLNGDGVDDLAVGNHRVNDGGVDQGAIWILFLNTDGSVSSEQKISATSGGFGGDLHPHDRFGAEVCAVGDLDGNGSADLAVGAPGDDDGDADQGAIWLLYLSSFGTVASYRKISAQAGGFAGGLDVGDAFGSSIGALGDLDGNGIGDLAVGASVDDDGAPDQGALWILFMNADGTVSAEQKISADAGGFAGDLDENDRFGGSVAVLGDVDDDGVVDLAVGAHLDDDGFLDMGAVWLLFLEIPDASPPTLSCPASMLLNEPKNGTPGEPVFFAVTASDNLDPSPSLVCNPPSGSFFPRGTTIVTCTATDEEGNQSVCTFPVVVMPTIRRRQL